MSIAVSATLAANEAIERRRRAGLPVLPLAFGEAGLPVHPALRERLAAAAGRNSYGPVAGITELRQAAAGYWQRRNLPTDPDSTICGPGSKPLLYALALALGGDPVLPRPSWVSYAAQARLAGTRPVFVDTVPGQGGVPDPEALVSAVTEARRHGRSVRFLVATLPDNPTGTVARPETVERLCAAAGKLDLLIVADEIYRDLIFDPATPYLSPAEVAPERTIITTALSKNLALGGWRIGVARLPGTPYGRDLRAHLAGVASEIWSSPAGPVQQVAAYAFGEPEELTNRVRESRRLHAAVARGVAERFAKAGVSVTMPEAGFYSYPDFEPWRELLSRTYGIGTGAGLRRFLMEVFGVGVLAGSDFGDHAEALRLRIATSMLYGESERDRLDALAAPDPLDLPWIKASLDRLDQVLEMIYEVRPDPTAGRTSSGTSSLT
ncbi:pyridoxal phosphate-dependent aminotransferase [Rhizohabitans arisaemae]|uniref:pyridoxal phosphate-dependent aminotransferase n=1 Tax=Rhizohabitans arisaemae TaxID=2720610 RepID=UPI0024B25751|nr:pyridoxal phosphate-dependent aminotransferase [Rhizohabitans arisaemae]